MCVDQYYRKHLWTTPVWKARKWIPTKKIAPHGYYEGKHRHGLCKHISLPIQFTLVVDDFGVKYTRQKDAEHLLGFLKKEFTAVSTYCKCALCCGITLEWNYEEIWLEISMPGYIKKVLQKYKHETSPRPQHSPYVITPKNYSKYAHAQLPPDESPKVSKGKIKRIQGVVGSILFYARSVDSTLLVGLNTISIQQTSATENTLKRTEELLDYAATHPDANKRYRAS